MPSALRIGVASGRDRPGNRCCRRRPRRPVRCGTCRYPRASPARAGPVRQRTRPCAGQQAGSPEQRKQSAAHHRHAPSAISRSRNACAGDRACVSELPMPMCRPYVWPICPATRARLAHGARIPVRPRFLRHRRRRRCRALRRRRLEHVRPHRRSLRAGRGDRDGLRKGPLDLPEHAVARPWPRGAIPRPDSSSTAARRAAPSSFHGAAQEVSSGKDTPSGHWEIAAVPVPFEWGYFPQTVPTFPRCADRGDHQRRQACPAFWATAMPRAPRSSNGSARSTSGPASRSATRRPTPSSRSPRMKTHFGLERLYDLCKTVRKLVDPLNIGRVIARPFVGETRRDLRAHRQPARFRGAAAGTDAARPADGARQQGHRRSARSATSSPIAASPKCARPPATWRCSTPRSARWTTPRDGDLVFANFVDFDTLFGHRRDIAGYAAALEAFDRRLPEALARLRPGDLLLLTADHGCDPSWRGTDHTRERVPVFGTGAGPRRRRCRPAHDLRRHRRNGRRASRPGPPAAMAHPSIAAIAGHA